MFPFPFSFFGGVSGPPELELIDNDFSMEFNGTDEYLGLPYSTVLNSGASGYTVSSWVNVDNVSGYKTIYSTEYDEGVILLIFNASIYYYHYTGSGTISPPTTTSGGTLTAGQWHHVVMTWDGSNSIKLYLDKVLVNTQTGATALDNPTAPSQYPKIGQYNTNWWMNGDLDEIAFWSRELDATEVETIYDSTNDNPGKCANLFTGGLGTDLVFWNRMGD